MRLLPRAALSLLLLPLLMLALPAPRALRAEDDPTLLPPPQPGRMSLYAKVDLAPHGDSQGRVEIHFAPEDWARVKASTPDPRRFLQDVHGSRSESEVTGEPKAGYDDDARAVVLTMDELGAARHLGQGRWLVTVEEGRELLAGHEVDGRLRAVLSTEGSWGEGADYAGRLIYLLPAGATDANWDASTHALTWTLPLPAPTGAPALDVGLRVKDRLMTTIYKVYGLKAAFGSQWVAKAVLRNTGGSVARDVRVRFRLDKYAEWSPWAKKGDMVPGQVVVEPYYPVLDASIARLRSNTPADVRVEWSWQDERGQKQADEDAGRLVLLGGGEYVFSNLAASESFGTWQEAYNNAPLLAAWVSRDDPVVKRMAAMANRMAGGLGAVESDENAVRVLAACYDLLRANDFTYQHPAMLEDKSVSFDPRAVQHVKLPRDVIRDRSGTCIDLAILMAAMANAVGIEPHLALIPGHCFPVFRLPKSGTLQGFEATGIAGGLRHGSADAMSMFQKGGEELQAAAQDGRIYLVDVRSLWTQGVANPELDELPAGILETWGIREEGRGTPAGGLQPGGAPQGGGEPAGGDDPFVGIFGGPVSERQGDGSTLTFPVRMGIDRQPDGSYAFVFRADVTVRAPDGSEQVVVLLEQGSGQRQGDRLVFTSTSRKAKAQGSQEEGKDVPGTVRIVARLQGDVLVGTHGAEDEPETPFRLPRERPQQAAPQPTPRPTPQPAGQDPFAGTWQGTVTQQLPQGGAITYPVRVGIDAHGGGRYEAGIRADISATGQDGSTIQVVIVEMAEGQRQGDTVRFRVTSRKVTDATTGESEEQESQNQLHVTLQRGGLRARHGSDAEGWTELVLQRVK